MATLIPHELYRHILSYLAPHDLCRVGTVSQSLHHETNHLLYRDVDLYGGYSGKLMSWAYAVSRNAKLGVIVRTLRLPTHILIPHDINSSFDWVEVAKAFTQAFGAIINLVSLRIDYQTTEGRHLGVQKEYLEWDYFKKSTFRLRFLRITGHALFEPHGLISFLSNQPEIEDWAPAIRRPLDSEFISQDMLSTSLLPQLAIVRLVYSDILDSPLLKFATSRPLVRLCISTGFKWDDEDSFIADIMVHVHQCRHTLLHFRLASNSPRQGLGPVKFIGTISRWLPGLKSLSLSWQYEGASIMMDNLNLDQVVQLTAALSKFTRLENLLVEHKLNSDDEIPQNLAKRLATTQQLFVSCATLQRVTFVETPFSQHWRPRSLLRASYRRLDDGKIYLEKNEGLDRSSWRELS